MQRAPKMKKKCNFEFKKSNT